MKQLQFLNRWKHPMVAKILSEHSPTPLFESCNKLPESFTVQCSGLGIIFSKRVLVRVPALLLGPICSGTCVIKLSNYMGWIEFILGNKMHNMNPEDITTVLHCRLLYQSKMARVPNC